MKRQHSPTVTIVMATYNGAMYLAEAIDSVLQQTYQDWELIVIDDGSTDKTGIVVKKYMKHEKRIIYKKNSQNLGLIASLNRGIAMARGVYIARLDSDDVWIDRTKLEKQITFLQRYPSYGLVGSFASVIDMSGKIRRELTLPVTDAAIKKYLLIENCFVHSAVVFRRDLAEKIGGYDPKFTHAEDYAFWLQFGLICRLYNFPECFVAYRNNPNGITKTKYRNQLQSTYKAVEMFGDAYPNYLLGRTLWQLRLFVPQSIKTFVSNTLIKSI
jgi:glycosyltransferase involved in cell wall biosynthesis